MPIFFLLENLYGQKKLLNSFLSVFIDIVFFIEKKKINIFVFFYKNQQFGLLFIL